jgi:hypothetical protein
MASKVSEAIGRLQVTSPVQYINTASKSFETASNIAERFAERIQRRQIEKERQLIDVEKFAVRTKQISAEKAKDRALQSALASQRIAAQKEIAQFNATKQFELESMRNANRRSLEEYRIGKQLELEKMRIGKSYGLEATKFKHQLALAKYEASMRYKTEALKGSYDIEVQKLKNQKPTGGTSSLWGNLKIPNIYK